MGLRRATKKGNLPVPCPLRAAVHVNTFDFPELKRPW